MKSLKLGSRSSFFPKEPYVLWMAGSFFDVERSTGQKISTNRCVPAVAQLPLAGD